MTVVTALAGEAGIFRWVAAVFSFGGARSAFLVCLVVAMVAVVCTVFLSLDATAVLLTRVVVGTARQAGFSVLPLALMTVWLANTASLLLPMSNLTNLLAQNTLAGIIPARFAAMTWAPALVLAGCAAGHRSYFPGGPGRALWQESGRHDPPRQGGQRWRPGHGRKRGSVRSAGSRPRLPGGQLRCPGRPAARPGFRDSVVDPVHCRRRGVGSTLCRGVPPGTHHGIAPVAAAGARVGAVPGHGGSPGPGHITDPGTAGGAVQRTVGPVAAGSHRRGRCQHQGQQLACVPAHRTRGGDAATAGSPAHRRQCRGPGDTLGVPGNTAVARPAQAHECGGPWEVYVLCEVVAAPLTVAAAVRALALVSR
ncbi:hypothetical protein G6N77_17565 [Arthrobacter silviterrae]|uniref:Citrate transporter-like domain-containing protein n=1 Tax=Arthrobacter silviterrae TaxID=2026658 RepID=A0ABX0DE94_9MICC|nr:hypothetical protein [Arthrobacter silviterrae]